MMHPNFMNRCEKLIKHKILGFKCMKMIAHRNSLPTQHGKAAIL